MKRVLLIAGLGATALLAAGPATAQIVLGRSAVATGCGVSSGASVTSTVTLGQAVIGYSESALVDACHGFWCGGVVRVLDAPEGPLPGADRPDRLAFGLPSPNPTRAGVQFELALPQPARASLLVLDVSGRQVAQVHDGSLVAGRHRLTWNGRGDDGGPLRAGVYFARLEVDGRMIGRRSVILIR